MSVGFPPNFAEMPAESQPILAEIRQTFGFIPPALGAVARDPLALRGAWVTTQTGYLQNPLPPLFKERFMAVMAKFNLTPYSLIVRSCTLRRMGMTGQQIVEFLRMKLPPQRLITEQLRVWGAKWTLRSGFSSMPHELEQWVLWAAARMTLRKDPAGRCRDALYAVLGDELFNQVVVLSAFAVMQRVWIDAHPDFDALRDQRVIEAHKALLKETPEFAQIWDAARKRATHRVPGPRERRLMAEIARQDRVREVLRDSESRFRKVVQSMPFPVMVYAADGEVILLNRAWTQQSGWRAADVPTMDDWFHKGQHDESLWEPADVEALYDWPEPVEEGEQTIYTASGQVRTWDFSTASIGKLSDGRQALMRTAVDVSERHRLQSALWETNERIGSIVEAITDGFVAMDRETRFLYYNRQAEKVLKIKAEAVLGKRFLEVFPIPESTPLYQAVLRCLGEGVTQHVEHYSSRVDTVYEVHLYPSTEGLSAYIRDIGERKRMEQALRDSEQKFRGLFESDMVGIMFADRFTGQILECNDALLRIVGYCREDLEQGKLNWKQLTAPGYDEVDRNAAQEVGRGPLVPYEKEYLHKEGHRVPILVGGAPVARDEAIVMAYVIDLTAQKEAERKTEQMHLLFDAIVRGSPLGIMLVNEDGAVKLWNPACERFFGWAEAEVVGRPAPVVPEHRQEAYHLMRKRVAEGESFSNREAICLTKGGGTRIMRLVACPVRDLGGRIAALMLMFSPVSLAEPELPDPATQV